MIIVQRVRVRWSPAGRGAAAANARRGLDRAMPLPSTSPTGDVPAHDVPAHDVPAHDVLVHDVLVDEAAGYAPRHEVRAGAVSLAEGCGLRLDGAAGPLVVERLPGSASYPRPGRRTRLFTLAPGEVGRYRANFRFTGCICHADWSYESWTVHVSHGPADLLDCTPDHDVDHRVHLYGGPG